MLDSVLEKTYTLVVRVVDFDGNKPIKNVGITVFRDEKEPITLKQWGENLKNGAPFKKLIFSMNTDNRGTITAELPAGDYEVKAEGFDLTKVCGLVQNEEVLFVEPKKHWWQ
jgi:hypothetical protein